MALTLTLLPLRSSYQLFAVCSTSLISSEVVLKEAEIPKEAKAYLF